MALRNHIWASGGSNVDVHPVGDSREIVPIQHHLTVAIQNETISMQKHDYNQKWFDNMELLYKFKHIIKFELLNDPNKERIDGPDKSAYSLLKEAMGINKQIFEENIQNMKGKTADLMTKQLLLKQDLIVSINDDHWSPKSNKWVFDNYILPKVVDILTEK